MPKGQAEHFAAARDLFVMLDEVVDGFSLVDTDARIVWLNDKQAELMGLASVEEAVGVEIERFIPHSRMREVVETGRSIPIDIMQYGDRTLMVSRLPLRNKQGEIIGAIAFALKNSLTYLRPIAERFNKLQSRLARMEHELAASRMSKYTMENLIGFSPVMLQLKRLVRKAGQINSAVLLLGETGTGKELVAHSIHAASQRVDRPFVGINVAAIPETLLEAEFFGVAPGAYTGASRQARPGKFQIAHQGTLFLDEIGDLSLPLQSKLLRVLQERELEPLGSNQVIKVDVRIIAATSRPLQQMVRDGTFRSDLFYRLNIFPIQLPSLRDHKQDLEILVAFFAEKVAISLDLPVREFSPSALEVLHGYDWPGNIRELSNVIEQVYVRTEGERITVEDFVDILPTAVVRRPSPTATRPLAQAIDDLERSLIHAALKETRGNKVEAARLLGLSRTNFYAKLHKHGISPEPEWISVTV
jgi:transcriptional regulator with PAS, ATPase and Fis domain